MKSTRGTSIVGRVVAALFGFILLAAGLVTLYFSGNYALNAFDSYSWVETSAQIHDSKVKVESSKDAPFSVSVRYVYLVNGSQRSGSSVYLEESNFADYYDAWQVLKEFPVGEEVDAFYNPDKVGQSILILPSFWELLLPLVSLPFLLIGGFVMLLGLRSEKDVERSISKGASIESAKNPLLRKLGGLFLLLISLILLYFIGKVLTEWQDAQSWKTVEATVIYSKVKTHRGDDGNTYSVDIFYSYDFEEKSYKSNRYALVSSSSSGYSSKKSVVAAHPPGTKFEVFVNPKDPSQATIKREMPWVVYFAVIPVVLIFVGLGLLFKKQRPPGEKTLFVETKNNYVRGFLLGLLIGGTLLFFGIQLWPSHGFPAGILIFFSLVAFYVARSQFLSSLNPVFTLERIDRTLSLGESVEVNWRLTGRTDRLSSFKVDLLGEELVKYTRGTDLVTEVHPFYEERIFESTSKLSSPGGNLTLSIPNESMHSLDVRHNKIVWRILATGEVSKRPEIKKEYKFEVSPHG